MLKLESLKKGDKIYLFDKNYVCFERTIIECEVVKKYAKSRKYILVNTNTHVYPGELDPVTYTNNEPFPTKLFKDAEEDIFSISDFEDAKIYRDKYDDLYEYGLMFCNDYCDDDPYELGKAMEEANDKACKNHDCENSYCSNDNCEYWDEEDHGGICKSDYDDSKGFIDNLDYDDPADEWFFED